MPECFRVQEAASAETTPIWNTAQVLERLSRDQELLREIAEIFLADCPTYMAKLRRGIAELDAEGVERTAHSLKGELSYLGISDLSEKAAELEHLGRECNLHNAAEVFAALECGVPAILNWFAQVREKNPGAQTGKENGTSQ